MKRLENLARILIAGVFAVAAVGAHAKGDHLGAALLLFITAMFLWRITRRD